MIVFQVADPFYVFQFCSIILWSTDEYYYYAVAILTVSLISIIITVYQTRKVSESLLLFTFQKRNISNDKFVYMTFIGIFMFSLKILALFSNSRNSSIN